MDSSNPDDVRPYRLAMSSSLDAQAVLRAVRDLGGAIVDFQYLYANDAACELLSREVSEVGGQTLGALSPMEAPRALVAFLAQLVGGSTSETGDSPVFASATLERFDIRAAHDGEIVGVTWRDVTKLRELADHYELLLGNMSDIVVRTDEEGRIVWIVDVVESSLGYAPSELVGVMLTDLLHPDDVETRRRVHDQLRGTDVVQFRLRLRAKNGEYHHFAASAHRLLDAQGRPVGVVKGLRPIDDEVNEEESVRRVDRLYRLLAENGTDVVAVERRGVVEWVSPYLEQLLNLTSDEVVGHSLSELVHPDDRGSLQVLHREPDNASAASVTLRMRMADSSYRWVAMRARDVDDDDGSRVRVVSWRDAQNDISSQRALIASESRYRLLAENSTDVIVECDERQVVRWVSPSALGILRWRSEDVVGTVLADHVFPADRQLWESQRRDLAMRNEAKSIEVRYLSATGTLKWVTQEIRKMRRMDGQGESTVVSLRDRDDWVALRYELDQERASLRLLSDNITDVVYSVNGEGELTWLSPSVTEQLGWQVNDLIGTNILEMVFPEDRPRVLAWRQLLHLGEEIDEITLRVRTADGDFVWMKVRAKPLRDAHERVTGVVVALSNCDAEIISARALRTLSAGSRALLRLNDVDELLSRMCQIAVEEGGYLLAWYGQKRETPERNVEVVAHSVVNQSYLDGLIVHWGDDEFSHGPTGRAIRSGEVVTTDNIDEDPLFAPWRDLARSHGFRSAAAIPVRVNGDVDGAWQVYAMEPRAFTPAVLSVLEDLALEIGYGLARFRATT